MMVAESLANAIIGLVISFCATWWVLGYNPVSSLAITLMFFCLSFARSYALRIVFDGLRK